MALPEKPILDNSRMAIAVIEEDALRALVREEVAATPREFVPWLNVNGAADYLATTEEGIRSLVKRNAIPVHRTPTGRLLFRPEELDAWVDRGDLRLDR